MRMTVIDGIAVNVCFSEIERLPPPFSPSLLCLPSQGKTAPLATSKPSKQITRCPASLTTHKHTCVLAKYTTNAHNFPFLIYTHFPVQCL